MPFIYHITTRQAWALAQEQGVYAAPSLKEEGFIHCSHENQLEGVMQRYFQGKTELIKLVIDADKLSSRMIYDWSKALTETFPHVYGPINLDAVVEVVGIN